MYNKIIKERFLSWFSKEKPTSRKIMTSYLGYVSAQEEALRKDIAEMDFNEAKSAVESADVVEYSTVRSMISALKRYAEWCSELEIFESPGDGVLRLSATDINLDDAYRRMIFHSEEHFLSEVRKVCDFSEGKVTPVILVLMWLGLTAQDILELNDSHVDLESGVIATSNGTVVSGISNEILEILRIYKNTKTYIRDNRTAPYPVMKDMTVDSFIKMSYPLNSTKFGQKNRIEGIRQRVITANRDYQNIGLPPRLTQKNIIRSALLEKMWHDEQGGATINGDFIVKVFGGKNRYDAQMMYETYKRTFGKEIPPE